LELVLPEKAELAELAPALLAPERIPGLWKTPEILARDVYALFSGGQIVRVPREGYDEPMAMPRAPRAIVDRAIEPAVAEGMLWLTSGPTTLWAEDVPAGLVGEDVRLAGPPPQISVADLLPENLADAYRGSETTAIGLCAALGRREGRPLPWARVREAVQGALSGRLLELDPTSAPWPCDYAGAAQIKLRLPDEAPPPPPPPPSGALVAEARLEVDRIQDLAERAPELLRIAAGLDLGFRVRIELGSREASRETIESLDRVLAEIDPELRLRSR
jgi:hypothetical protein